MNRLGAVAVTCSALAVGCGDPPICQSEIFIAIQTSEVSIDADGATNGVQGNIRVRTTAGEGEQVVLEVFLAGTDQLFTPTPTATVDATGVAIFEKIDLPSPMARIRATVDVFCGDASDEITIPVATGTSCELTFSPSPDDNAFFAPARVFNSLTDPDPVTAGYQTNIIVNTAPGSTVEIFENANNADQALGTFASGVTGIVEIARTLADGTFSYRAFCTSGTTAAVSPATAVVVDVTPPTCAFAVPSPGTTITPAFDTSPPIDDGVQLLVTAQVTGNDVQDEPTTLAIGPAGGTLLSVSTAPLDANGRTVGSVTLDPPTSPFTFTFQFTARDHAQNPCTATEDFVVALDACNLILTSPTTPVTSDADGIPANGSQLDVSLQVSAACEGRTVTSTCGVGSPSGVVTGGQVTLRTDFCQTSPCEQSTLCTFEVTNPDGVTTTTSATLQFDDLGPPTSLAIITPALSCNSQITPAADADPAIDGVQIVARVTSTGAATRSVELTNGAGTSTADASTDVTVTLAPGTNALVGIGTDALGNDTRTTACNVTLADLTVSFSPPASDGHIARADGTVVGNTTTFPLCGTVNKLGATVTVSVDGGAPINAIVTGTNWCATITLVESPPNHTIVATATAGASFGNATLVVAVDLTLPPQVDNFLAATIHRHLIRLVWESPSDNGQRVVSYVAKISTTPLTDANFDVTGLVLATTAPLAPGANEELDFDTARLGTTYFVGLATFDAAGNRSVASIQGPILTALDRTGGIAAPDPLLGSLRFGTAIAHGRFNDDDFDDLAVSAPTQNVNATTTNAGAVYIYFGSASGISTTPDAILTSAVANGRFGSGLTAIRLSSTTRDDLVVGAPGLDTHGRISIFRGGATFVAGPRDATTAELTITANATSPGFFASSALGSWLVTADVNGDSTPDLVASAPTGNAITGGIAIIYGDTLTTSITLSDIDTTGINGAIVELFTDTTLANRQLGTYLHNVGPTAGPLDVTDDLVVAYFDDNTTTDRLFVLRSDGSRPATPGVTARPFVVGRDVRLDYSSPSVITEFGAQATSLGDRDGDGARELVVSAHRNNNDRGQVLVISGDFLGTAGVARTDDVGLVLTTINGGGGNKLGALILANDGVSEFDNDGIEDLLVVGRVGAGATGFLWYGELLPDGTTTTATASTTFAAPSTFKLQTTRTGSLGIARWSGDLDGDGVPDVCWASRIDTLDDGSFEVFD